MSTGVRIAAALTRAWVQLYTIGMPADLREIRRAEIDADLWDHGKDAQENAVPPAILATEILLRTALGIPDDLSWRVEAIQIRRAASPEGGIPMIALSAKQVRWMGLGGVLGGILWAANALTIPTGSLRPGVVSGYAHIALSLLFIVGLLGFYAQHRDRAGKVARAGFVLLFTSFLAWSALNVLGTGFGVGGETLFMNLLAVAFVLLLPPGFLLLGIGLKGPSRRVPLALGILFLARVLLSPVLVHYFPNTASFFGIRGDSAAGITVFFLMGIGVALMGYSVFRNPAAATGSRR
jgi:hypothetical protein